MLFFLIPSIGDLPGFSVLAVNRLGPMLVP